MRTLWMRIRIPLAIVALLLIALALARIFSGPEDTWIRDGQGAWVRHGFPSGPPPELNFQEPFIYQAVPLVFLAAFAVPLLFFGMHKLKNRLHYDTASRDLRFYGYLSLALFLLGIFVGAGLALELGLGASGAGFPDGRDLMVAVLFFISLAGSGGLCILLGFQLFVLKRNCNDHYQLEKSHREIMEALVKLSPK